MKCLKLRVSPEDRIADVFLAVKKSDAAELLLICPRQWSVLTDASLLKRLHEENPKKKIIFVIEQKFSRDFVSQLGFAAVASCPETSDDIEEIGVNQELTGEVFTAPAPEPEAPVFTSKKDKSSQINA